MLIVYITIYWTVITICALFMDKLDLMDSSPPTFTKKEKAGVISIGLFVYIVTLLFRNLIISSSAFKLVSGATILIYYLMVGPIWHEIGRTWFLESCILAVFGIPVMLFVASLMSLPLLFVVFVFPYLAVRYLGVLSGHLLYSLFKRQTNHVSEK